MYPLGKLIIHTTPPMRPPLITIIRSLASGYAIMSLQLFPKYKDSIHQNSASSTRYNKPTLATVYKLWTCQAGRLIYAVISDGCVNELADPLGSAKQISGHLIDCWAWTTMSCDRSNWTNCVSHQIPKPHACTTIAVNACLNSYQATSCSFSLPLSSRRH